MSAEPGRWVSGQRMRALLTLCGEAREIEDDIAGRRPDPIEQHDLVLEAGDEPGLDRIGEAQLPQCADAVRVAVEDVDSRHGDTLGAWPGPGLPSVCAPLVR